MYHLRFAPWLAACISIGIAAAAPGGEAVGSLAEGFRQPPASARPWVYWFIMDGNLSRDGITTDLEAMHRAGIGGVIMMEVDVGIPRGPVRFMSEPWRELFAHAVSEAQRLGLQVTLNAGPGWTGSGGPWVRPEQSMQHLVASETNVTGPTRFDAGLPQPPPRRPFFGEGALPPALEQARKAFYRDVAVLAFPAPEGAERIADIEEKALYIRAPYSSQPGVKPYLPAPAEHRVLAAGQCIDAQRIVDLTAELSPDGHLRWDVPEGRWTILRFGRTSTGQNTRPAPESGLGLECDKFDKAALDAHFEAFIGPLLEELGGRRKSGSGWTMLHIDSWEMGAQNWTAKFREEFQNRRGYNLLRYLPVMTGRVVQSVEVSERFLWDLRQTAQELVVENHALHLKALGRRHGFGLSIEPYDMNPCADLSLGGVADVPMCEFWAQGHGFSTEYSCFEAVSIAHTMGRPVVAAESFTAGDSERWQLYPGALKAQGDWAFCAGINRIVFHRYQHQPWLDRWPGMTMGPYGVHWERTQTWWDLVPAYHAYLARCQYLLRQGLPVADICYLVPEGAPHVFRPPASALSGDPPSRRGYSFDGCAPEVLRERFSVRDGRLVLPDGMSYRVLVLPQFETMTPGLLRKVKDLVEAGATVIGSPPRKSPSLSNYPDCDREVRGLARELWGDQDRPPQLTARRVGEGRVYWGGAAAESGELYPGYDVAAEVLGRLGVVADFEADTLLRYTHRRAGEVDICFVANPEGRPLTTKAAFRVTAGQPELWDAVTGERRALPEFTRDADRTIVPLRFEPHQSYFLVFHPGSAETPRHGGNFPNTFTLMELTGPWEVHFQANRGAPEHATFAVLQDWPEHSDPGVKCFSGVATYRAGFDWTLPASHPSDRAMFLDLGKVCVMAGVRLNERDLGVVWTPPFRVDVTEALRSGANTLEIRVVNLWPNRLIGDAGLPPEKRVAWTTWNPFKADARLLESGLLGPVTIVMAEDEY